MVNLGSMPGYGIQSMLKEGHRHLSGLQEALLKNIDGEFPPCILVVAYSHKYSRTRNVLG
jgi:hypothetical protein